MPEVESFPIQTTKNRHKSDWPDADTEVLAGKIQRAIRRETNDRVRLLKIEFQQDCVVMFGRCGTYYCKQQANQAAIALLTIEKSPDFERLVNKIEVW